MSSALHRKAGASRFAPTLLSAIAAAFLIAPSGWGQSPVASSVAGDGLPMWEVQHEGRTLYLLGSVHMLRPDAYPLPDELYRAFDSAEAVAFELDLDEMVAAAPAMMARGLYLDGRTVRDALPPETWSELDQRVRGFGLPVEAIQTMKPWLLSLTLTSLAMQQGGYDAEHGLDLHFFQRARDAGKDVVALETVEEQIGVFDDLSEAGQVSLLRSTLRDLDRAVAQMNEVSDLWISGDAEKLAEILTESTADQPELMDRLLVQRNRNWIEPIEALLRERQTSIVIVGMAHLAGEESVVELLEGRGYRVDRVARARR